jgi:iron(III) transport system substrate-binding protein
MAVRQSRVRARRMRRVAGAMVVAAVVLGLAAGRQGCTRDTRQTVVVYVAHDEMYSRPILDDFERETGLRVLAQYDTEASKTTGLANRLIAERTRPRADVFWNNEVAQTIRVKHEGALEAYASPSAAGIPETFRDAEGYWTGFAARARVIIYNTELVDEPPRSIQELANPEWKGRAAMANPLFGTTATQAAAWFASWGDERAIEFLRAIRANGVAILPGNSAVRDLVARGEYSWGLTDTDDANGAVEDGFPVKWLLPDQDPDGAGLGTLLIPNTVSLVRGGPNPDAGRRLIDFLLRPETEAALAASRSIQIPLRPDVPAPETVPRIEEIQTMHVEFDAIAAKIPAMMDFAGREFAP